MVGRALSVGVRLGPMAPAHLLTPAAAQSWVDAHWSAIRNLAVHAADGVQGQANALWCQYGAFAELPCPTLGCIPKQPTLANVFRTAHTIRSNVHPPVLPSATNLRGACGSACGQTQPCNREHLQPLVGRQGRHTKDRHYSADRVGMLKTAAQYGRQSRRRISAAAKMQSVLPEKSNSQHTTWRELTPSIHFTILFLILDTVT